MNDANYTTQHPHPDALILFSDGELSSAEHREIEQHIRACHACTLRVLSNARLKVATKQAGQRFTPSAAAMDRFIARTRPSIALKPPVAAPKPVSHRWFNPALGWGALAAMILIGISLLIRNQVHQTNTLAAELLDQHLGTLSNAAVPQVLSTDRHTVKPWFQGRLPFSFNIPDASVLPPDTTLKGADLTYLNGQPAALLLFTIQKHNVSVFLTQRSTAPASAPLPHFLSGFTVQSATVGDLRIVAVSDVNPVELDHLVTILYKAQNPS
jgi:anti-sigma factor RsiW